MLIPTGRKGRRGRVSYQVLGGVLRQRGQDTPQHAKKRGEIRDLLAWNPVTADATTLERGWKLQERYGLSHCDRPIVAATKAASCSYVLTEDLQAGQRFETE